MTQELNYGIIHKITRCAKKLIDELPDTIENIKISGDVLYTYSCFHPNGLDSITYDDFSIYMREIEQLLLDPNNMNNDSIKKLQDFNLFWVDYWYENDQILNDCIEIDLHRFENLTECWFSHIYINNIINIPPKLENLYVVYCELNFLSDLPNTLVKLNCNSNNILILPVIQHTKLKKLYCCSNKLHQIPPLPNTLEILQCYQNRLRFLPKLPKSLENLSCASNRLYILPDLPIKLEGLYCNHNSLQSLPTILPLFLRVLHCNHNRLHNLPNIPPFLRTLVCHKNYLKEYPILPPSLEYVNMDGTVMEIRR